MDDFYATAKATYQQKRRERDLAVINTWKNCVLKAAREAKTPTEITDCVCTDRNPSLKALEQCSTPEFRVIAVPGHDYTIRLQAQPK